MINKMNN